MISMYSMFIWTLNFHLNEKRSECAFPISVINHFLASSHNCKKRLMDFLYLITMEYERGQKNLNDIRSSENETVWWFYLVWSNETRQKVALRADQTSLATTNNVYVKLYHTCYFAVVLSKTKFLLQFSGNFFGQAKSSL